MQDLFSIAITLLFAGVIFIAMAFDMWSRRVPNMVSVALVLLFAVAAGVAWDKVDWWSHIGFGLGMFSLGAILFYVGWFGGGDVKLLGALSLWMGVLFNGFSVLVIRQNDLPGRRFTRRRAALAAHSAFS